MYGQLLLIFGYLYLIGFSVYHVFTGIISVFFPDFALKTYKKIYGFHPVETKQLKLSLRPWGNLALIVGVSGFVVLYDVNLYKLFLLVFALLLAIRIWYRLAFYQEMAETLKTTKSQNYRMIIIQTIGVITFIMYYLILPI